MRSKLESMLQTPAPTSKDILDIIKSRKLVYEHYVTGNNVYYPDSIAKKQLAQDILQKIDIVELVEEAVKFGIDNHNKYGDEKQTKEVIACSPLSLLFKILGDLNLAHTGDE